MRSSNADDPEARTTTLEAFADTIIPGRKRSANDLAIAGVATSPGAVECGAIEVLEDPAVGILAGLDGLVAALNAHAEAYATEHDVEPDQKVPPFVGLTFEHRTELVRRLTAPGNPERDGWVVLALFCNMAFDTAPHLHTAEAIAAGHPGLTAMGFASPDTDGLWRFGNYSYGRKLADLHPDTDSTGSLG